MPVKDAVRTFKVLSDPMRLRIVLLLMEKDLCVCELMFILKMEQSRLSHQLRVLRHAGMVEDVREGRWMIYRISPAARKTLETLSRTILRHDLKESADVLRDVKRMDVCLKEEIRLKHGSRSRAARERGRRAKG
jgi:ArsR family transcriptional regulator, arsenate/arsenite/antimonite-responsive transcriptional repressor